MDRFYHVDTALTIIGCLNIWSIDEIFVTVSLARNSHPVYFPWWLMVHRWLFIPNIKLIVVSAPLSQSGLALFRKIGVARKTCIICHLPTVITYKYSSYQWRELSQTHAFENININDFAISMSCRFFPGHLFKDYSDSSKYYYQWSIVWSSLQAQQWVCKWNCSDEKYANLHLPVHI